MGFHGVHRQFVVPGMTGEESGDGSEEEHDDVGGCNASGSGGASVLALFALVGLVRRRR